MNKIGFVSKSLIVATGLAAIACLTGCATAAGGAVADSINPYAADQSGGLGERNTNALGGGGSGGRGAVEARKALENLGRYDRAHAPQPVYPVIRPAEVRLMWIPDHLSLEGNLVPAHYYFLKVTNDDWAVQDAFEVENQFNAGSGGADYGTGGTGAPAGGAGYGGATPWVYKEGR